MSKPIFMSWKTYAEKLELREREFREEEKYILKTDGMIADMFRFPSINSLIEYIELKATVNLESAARVIADGECVTPVSWSLQEIETRKYLNGYKKTLEAHLETARVFRVVSKGVR